MRMLGKIAQLEAKFSRKSVAGVRNCHFAFIGYSQNPLFYAFSTLLVNWQSMIATKSVEIGMHYLLTKE
jgi:hypothetical protein